MEGSLKLKLASSIPPKTGNPAGPSFPVHQNSRGLENTNPIKRHKARSSRAPGVAPRSSAHQAGAIHELWTEGKPQTSMKTSLSLHCRRFGSLGLTETPFSCQRHLKGRDLCPGFLRQGIHGTQGMRAGSLSHSLHYPCIIPALSVLWRIPPRNSNRCTEGTVPGLYPRSREAILLPHRQILGLESSPPQENPVGFFTRGRGGETLQREGKLLVHPLGLSPPRLQHKRFPRRSAGRFSMCSRGREQEGDLLHSPSRPQPPEKPSPNPNPQGLTNTAPGQTPVRGGRGWIPLE